MGSSAYGLRLTDAMLAELGSELGFDGASFKKRLEGSGDWSRAPDGLEGFRVDDLKKIARYINTKFGKQFTYSKMHKSELAQRLGEIIFVQGHRGGEPASHHGGRVSSSAMHQQHYASSASSSPYSSQHSMGSSSQKGPLVVRLPNHHAPGAQLPAYMKDMKMSTLMAMHKNGEPPSSATGQQGGSPSTLQARSTSGGSFSSRRVRSDPFFKPLKMLIHKDVCAGSVNLHFQLEPSWRDKDGQPCSIRARIFEYAPTNSTQGLLHETGWVLPGQLVLMGRPVNSLPKKKKHEHLRKVSNYLSPPVVLDDYVQAGPNSGRVFASEERFTIIIQHGMLRTVEDVARDVRNQSTGDPLDTPAMLKRLLGSTGGAGDDDDLIMSDDMEVSLRCPLSMMRIAVPARGKMCSHAQCFDLMTFLEFAKRHFNWLCPLCSKPLEASDLRTDNFFQKVVNELSKDSDQAMLSCDGSFRAVTVQEKNASIATTSVLNGKKRSQSVGGLDNAVLEESNKRQKEGAGQGGDAGGANRVAEAFADHAASDPRNNVWVSEMEGGGWPNSQGGVQDSSNGREVGGGGERFADDSLFSGTTEELDSMFGSSQDVWGDGGGSQSQRGGSQVGGSSQSGTAIAGSSQGQPPPSGGGGGGSNEAAIIIIDDD